MTVDSKVSRAFFTASPLLLLSPWLQRGWRRAPAPLPKFELENEGLSGETLMMRERKLFVLTTITPGAFKRQPTCSEPRIV